MTNDKVRAGSTAKQPHDAMVPLHEDDGSWMKVRNISISYGNSDDDILNIGWFAIISWDGENQVTRSGVFAERTELYLWIEKTITDKT